MAVGEGRVWGGAIGGTGGVDGDGLGHLRCTTTAGASSKAQVGDREAEKEGANM